MERASLPAPSVKALTVKALTVKALTVKALTVLPDSAWGGRLSSLSVRLALRRGLVGGFLRFEI
jgi:hypothetical protein